MNIHVDKTSENKSQDVTNALPKLQGNVESTFQFMNNRPEAIAQLKLQEAINNSPRMQQLKAYQEMANNSAQAKQVAQLQAMGAKVSTQQQPIQKKENNTGLPDNLKTGIENLSGYSMDDVKVHRNSDKPAQLQAHAYAQGKDIHLGPGQEKHLPHEAWHVVQQKQGRVKPTMQMKGKVNINDDDGLEKEADVMGAKALQFVNSRAPIVQRNFFGTGNYTIQREIDSTIPDRIQDKNEFREEYNTNILAQVNATKKWSEINRNIFKKLHSNMMTSFQKDDLPSAKAELKRLILLSNTIQGEMDSEIEPQWHPTGGAVPQLELALNEGLLVYFHFTDGEGFARIKEAGAINDSRKDEHRDGSMSGVYIAPGAQTFNSQEALDILFLGQEKYAERGGYTFAFVLGDKSKISQGAPLSQGSPFKEVIHYGDIDFKENRLLYAGPNPFITGLEF